MAWFGAVRLAATGERSHQCMLCDVLCVWFLRRTDNNYLRARSTSLPRSLTLSAQLLSFCRAHFVCMRALYYYTHANIHLPLKCFADAHSSILWPKHRNLNFSFNFVKFACKWKHQCDESNYRVQHLSITLTAIEFHSEMLDKSNAFCAMARIFFETQTN